MTFSLYKHMRQALSIAEKSIQSDEVPVGAILVLDGEIIAAHHNRCIMDHDPTAHAEMLVIREGCSLLKTTRLEQCALYVTLEPCAMCAQAIAHARVPLLAFGAYDTKGGGVEHGARVFSHSTCHHQPEIIGGILETECGLLLKDFFRKKRNRD